MALQALAALVGGAADAAGELLAAGGPRALAAVLADDFAQGQLREGAADALAALVEAHRRAGAAVRRVLAANKASLHPEYGVHHGVAGVPADDNAQGRCARVPLTRLLLSPRSGRRQWACMGCRLTKYSAQCGKYVGEYALRAGQS